MQPLKSLKTHTLALDTFKSMEFGPIGIVDEENVLYYHVAHHKLISLKPKQFNKQVEIVKAYSGSSSQILNLLIEHDVKGIVIEALGRGNGRWTVCPGKVFQFCGGTRKRCSSGIKRRPA